MMVRKCYRFAGLEFLVEMPEEIIYTEERRLAPFRVETVTDPSRFTFEMVDALTPPEGKLIVSLPGLSVYVHQEKELRYIGGDEPYLRTESRGKHHFVQVRKNQYSDRIGTKTVLESMGAEHLIAQNHGFFFHCAYIDHNGKAILFTAPSGTGKSTQADLWKQYRGAQIINGDRAAVRLAEGKILAEGIPYSGSSRYCENRSLPLEAIVYLGQAPQTSVRKMGGYEAFSRIWEGISVNTWDREDMERTSTVVQRIVERIPVFHMPCTPDESAVIALEQELRKLETL